MIYQVEPRFLMEPRMVGASFLVLLEMVHHLEENEPHIYPTFLRDQYVPSLFGNGKILICADLNRRRTLCFKR